MIGKFNRGTFDLLERGLPTDWQAMPNSTLSVWIKANLDIVRGDYHIFGNDKLALTRNDSKIAVVQNVPEKQCILWNKLGSDTEVLQSEIGSNLTIVGSTSYNTCKFDGGYSLLPATTTDRLTVPFIHLPYGCIEVWWKPNFDWDEEVTNFEQFVYDSRSGYNTIFLYYSDFTDRWVVSIITHAGYETIHFTTIPFLANDLLHIAILWDHNGIDGTSETVRFYINGVPTDVYSGSNTVELSHIPKDTTLTIGNSWDGGVATQATLDNIKIWNYAKTDFSDREIEDAANFIEGDNGISIPSDSEYHHMGCRINQDQSFDLFLDGEKVHSSAMKIPDECFEDLEEKFRPNHWYKLDEASGTTAYDGGKSPAADGTNTGPATVNQIGKRGKCYDFSGTGQYIDCGTTMGTEFGNGVTAISIGLWFKSDNYTDHDGIINLGSFSDSQGELSVHIYLSDIIFRLSNMTFTQSYAFTDNDWHHLVVTFDGSYGDLWLDGNRIIHVAHTTALNLSGLKTIIGAYYSTSHPFDGKIDDVRVYRRALSGVDVRQLYEYMNNYYLPQPRISIGETVSGRLAKPKYWWSLNERSGTTSYNKGTGLIEGSNSNAIVNKLGVNGDRCYYFNGTSSKVAMPIGTAAFERTDPFTLSAWIKSATGDNLHVFSNWDNPGTSKGYIFAKLSGDNKLMFILSNDYGGGANVLNVIASNAMPLDTWMHVVLTYDGSSSAGGVKIYENGQQISIVISTDTLSATTVSPIELFIGATDWPTWSKGNIQDARIYDFVVTDEEARQLYDLGRTPNGEVCDIRYDRVALSDDEIKFLAESNRPTDPEQDAKERHIRL